MASEMNCDIIGLPKGKWFAIVEPDMPAADRYSYGPFESWETACAEIDRWHGQDAEMVFSVKERSIEEVLADPDLKESIEEATGKSLKRPWIPFRPVDVSRALGDDIQGEVDGIPTVSKFIPLGVASEVRFNQMDGVGQDAEVIGCAQMVATRSRKNGIEVEIQCHDDTSAGLGDWATAKIEERAEKIFPGEKIAITVAYAPALDYSELTM
ncbi:MAG: hypothetical protein ABJN42_09985 [Roseibium sp.]|uniref:hypothetical protein n=1 Tax=Roseibium sp. TaxID=1936156 RepID=UPI003299AE37